VGELNTPSLLLKEFIMSFITTAFRIVGGLGAAALATSYALSKAGKEDFRRSINEDQKLVKELKLESKNSYNKLKNKLGK
jgi:hypothetical protein